MPSPFTITTNTPTVQLDSHRRGEASYTASNATGHPIRGRARLIAPDQTRLEWLAVVGEMSRDFPASGTEQYKVKIEVPDTAAAGKYQFQLDMVGVDNPDELYSQGQPVTFSVYAGAPPPPPQKDKGYVTTVIGGIVGLLAGVPSGAIVAILVALIFQAVVKNPDSQTSATVLVSLLILFIAFLWLGMAIGSWLALKIRKYDWAGITGIIYGIVLPVWVVIVFLIASAVNQALGHNPAQGIVALLVLLALGLVVVVPALIARAITLRWKTGHI